MKIGALLAIGFGEAGAGIICQYISKENDLEPLLAGKRVFAIFGFCDIRKFTDTTEILQEKVMLFVNLIASVIHETIYEN